MSLPVATDISARTLSLPLGPDLTEQDQLDVVSALDRGLDGRVPVASSVSAQSSSAPWS